MVPDVGFEPTTYRLQGGCSTPELIRLMIAKIYITVVYNMLAYITALTLINITNAINNFYSL